MFNTRVNFKYVIMSIFHCIQLQLSCCQATKKHVPAGRVCQQFYFLFKNTNTTSKKNSSTFFSKAIHVRGGLIVLWGQSLCVVNVRLIRLCQTQITGGGCLLQCSSGLLEQQRNVRHTNQASNCTSLIINPQLETKAWHLHAQSLWPRRTLQMGCLLFMHWKQRA